MPTVPSRPPGSPQIRRITEYLRYTKYFDHDCWAGRDKFFTCLDNNGIIDPAKDPAKTKQSCSADEAEFREGCVATWVDYFCKKRVLEIQRDNMIKEAQRRGANILTSDDVRHPAGRRDST